MGKQKRKQPQQKQKINKFERTCDRCGNENFSFKPVFKCRFCGKVNGIQKESEQNG